MKRIFLLFMLLGTSANATTMCVPDLSNCRSCTNGTTMGPMWSADCCGTKVIGGIAFLESSSTGDDKIYGFNRLPTTTLMAYNGNYRCLCYIVSPIQSISMYSADIATMAECPEECVYYAVGVLQTLYTDIESGPDDR